MPPIEHAAFLIGLLDHFERQDGQSLLAQCLRFLASLSSPDVITLNDAR
jgi:hypothetical protein